MYQGIDGSVRLDDAARRKAARLNPKYAYSVPWHRSYGKIAVLLGFANMSPAPEAFADGVAGWQASRAGLKVDGILGPNTWKAMQPETAFSNGAATLPDPAWLRETTHKAQAEPAKGGRANSGTWVGLSAEVCWIAGAAGKGTVVQYMISVDDPSRTFFAFANRVKIGFGAGYGVSASAVIMTNVYKPSILVGRQFGSWDFNLSIGTRIAALLKNSVQMHKMTSLLEGVKRIHELEKHQQRAEAMKLGRKFTKIGADQAEVLAKFYKENAEAYVNLGDEDPTVSLIALPLPGMVEVSAHYVDDRYDFVDH